MSSARGIRRPGLRWLATAAGVALAASAMASETPGNSASLTLEDAIHIALADSPRLAAAGLRRQAAAAELTAVRADRLPRVAATATAQRSDHPVLTFGYALAQERFTADDFAIDRLNDPAAASDWALRLAISQPLWTGGRQPAALAVARAGDTAAVHDLAATHQDLLHQVVAAHTAAIVAEHRLVVSRQALATAESHARLAADLFAAGLVVESDPLQGELRVRELRDEADRAASDAEVAAVRLNLVIGRDPATPLRLPSELIAPSRHETGDLAALTATALESRPDLAAARERLVAAEAAADLAHAARRPEVAWNGGYETHDEDFFAAGGDHWVVAVEARVPLFDRGLAARSAAAGSRAEAARRELEHFADAIVVEVRQAVSELATAEARLTSSAGAVRLAQRSLAIVEDRYREGLATLPELSDAQTALTSARHREVGARADALLTSTRLDLATGRLAAPDSAHRGRL